MPVFTTYLEKGKLKPGCITGKNWNFIIFNKLNIQNVVTVLFGAMTSSDPATILGVYHKIDLKFFSLRNFLHYGEKLDRFSYSIEDR